MSVLTSDRRYLMGGTADGLTNLMSFKNTEFTQPLEGHWSGLRRELGRGLVQGGAKKAQRLAIHAAPAVVATATPASYTRDDAPNDDPRSDSSLHEQPPPQGWSGEGWSRPRSVAGAPGLRAWRGDWSEVGNHPIFRPESFLRCRSASRTPPTSLHRTARNSPRTRDHLVAQAGQPEPEKLVQRLLLKSPPVGRTECVQQGGRDPSRQLYGGLLDEPGCRLASASENATETSGGCEAAAHAQSRDQQAA